MKYKTQYDLSHVTSMAALKREQLTVRKRIKGHEEELRLKMYEIPAELAAAGANTLIPKMLRGKFTDAALNGGKKLLNKFFVPDNNEKPGLLINTIKKPGVLSLLTKGIGLLKGKK